MILGIENMNTGARRLRRAGTEPLAKRRKEGPQSYPEGGVHKSLDCRSDSFLINGTAIAVQEV